MGVGEVGCRKLVTNSSPKIGQLRAKKYDEIRDIWQARVNSGWRFYFVIRGDLYYLLDLIPHPK